MIASVSVGEAISGLFDVSPERKWWRVELRFTRPLTKREVRALATAQGLDCGHCGVDGAVWEQWPERWPKRWSERYLVAALRKMGLPFRIRAAPLGHGCVDPECMAECTTATSNACACDPDMSSVVWRASTGL